MARDPTIHILETWGDFACFSRPEMKVERWSYPCPTPSAARGVFDAIYFKPQFHWQVKKIELLTIPSYIALRRNEVGAKAPADRTIESWANGGQVTALFADAPEHRQQRQTMALRDPHFRLHARIVPRPDFESQQTAFNEQFVRRASQGKCVWQPCLGCREFVAFFKLVEDLAAEDRDRPAVRYDQDIGMMLYDVFDLSQPQDCRAGPFITLFDAKIRGGVLDVPPFESDEVLKPARVERRAV
jgi:CRISPR-associated protein Cas5d